MPTSERRTRIVLLLLLVILLLCLAGLGFLLWHHLPTTQPSEPPPKQPQTPPEAAAHAYASPYTYAGLPASTAFSGPILVLTNTGYLVGYSESKEDPVWVCYRLYKTTTLQAPPRPSGFLTDPRTRSQVSQTDYTGSGYDRGHLAPNYAIALCYGVQAQQETFLMSNIIPQDPDLNRKVWEHLEEVEIRDYAQRFGQIWVVDGPVFKGSNTLRSGVAVPSACFKILVRESNESIESNGVPDTLAFIIPQTVTGTESPEQFLTSIDEIEKETGLDFFADLPDDIETGMEAEVATREW